MTDYLDCQICCDEFDDDEHMPMLPAHCGHSICRQCSNIVEKEGKKCPTCKKEFSNPVPNFTLSSYEVQYTTKPYVPCLVK